MRPREKQYTESIKNSFSQRRAYPKFQGLTKEREKLHKQIGETKGIKKAQYNIQESKPMKCKKGKV